MSLINLPPPDVIETLSYETLLEQRKVRLLQLAETHYQQSGELEKYQLLAQSLTLASEPLVKLLEESAYRELLLRQRVNDAARAVMLPLASGNDLDNLGALYGVNRGQFGAEQEGDQPYRQRLLLAPKSLSTAGAKAAYKFHALSAGSETQSIEVNSVSPNELQVSYHYGNGQSLIKDASVNSPSPCVVDVSLLGFDQYGQLDSQAIEKVTEHLNDDKVRPLGDRVSVSAAELVLYQWQIELHLTPALEGSVQLDLLLQQVHLRLIQFVKQHHFLAKAIRYSTLLGAISPLIDGWVNLQLIYQGQALDKEQDLILTEQQAPYLDLSAAPNELSWDEKLHYSISQSIGVSFDG